jgi:hypothetical protein
MQSNFNAFSKQHSKEESERTFNENFWAGKSLPSGFEFEIDKAKNRLFTHVERGHEQQDLIQKRAEEKSERARKATVEEQTRTTNAAYLDELGYSYEQEDVVTKNRNKAKREHASETSRLDDLVFGRKAAYITKDERREYGVRNFERESTRDANIKDAQAKKMKAFDDVLEEDALRTYNKEEKRKTEKRKTASGFDVTKSALGSLFYDPTLNKKTAKGIDKYKSIFSDWHDPELKGLGRERAKINAKQTVLKPWEDLIAGREDRAVTHKKERGFFYGGGLQPSGVGTPGYPRGYFPVKSGYPARPHNPLAHSELMFFGNPRRSAFGIRPPLKGTVNRKTGRIKISAAERKRAQRQAKKQPRDFFGDLFGGF